MRGVKRSAMQSLRMPAESFHAGMYYFRQPTVAAPNRAVEAFTNRPMA
jgi:hypothetical protein